MNAAPRRLAFPTPYTVLMAVIVLAAAATWFVPPGRYATVRYDSGALVVDSLGTTRSLPATQRTLDSLGVPIRLGEFTDGSLRKPVAVPGSYRRTEGHRQGALDVLRAPIDGVYEAIDVILFVLVIGGFIGVFNRSGAFAAGVAALARRLRGREAWLIVIVLGLTAIGGTTFGMAEETLAFYPLLVPVFLAAGFDRLVPVAAIYLGSTLGSMASTTNPFATIVASDAAGVAWTTGLGGRLLMLVLATALGIGYVVRYARRVRADPSRSLVRGSATVPAVEASIPPAPRADPGAASVEPEAPAGRVPARMQALLVGFAGVFLVMIVGVSRLGWWFPEMTALFFGAALVVGAAMRWGERTTVDAFLDGTRDLLGVAFIIGIARGVTLVLDRGEVSGTILASATDLVAGVPGVAFLLALLVVFAVLAVFVPSSSGLAVLTMPIFGGLADVAGVPRYLVVNAYLFGANLAWLLAPSGLILPSLSMVDVDFGAWVRFAAPLLGLLAALAAAFLAVGALLG